MRHFRPSGPRGTLGQACLIAFLLACLPLAGHADVLETRSPASITLPTNPGTNIVILSMTLPVVGQYAAIAKASIVNWMGQEDYFRCGLVLNNVALDSGVTVIGGPIAPSAATVVTTAKVTTTAANQLLTVQCNHDHALAGVWVDPGASLEVTATPPGPQGDPGIAGARGATGPASSTYGLCASVNASLPTSQSCSCPSGKLLSQVQTAGTCSVTTQSNPCSARGYVAPGGIGSPSYAAACCVCHS